LVRLANYPLLAPRQWAVGMNSTDTQRMRARRLQEESERQGRMIALMLAIEIIGFTVTIVLELVKC
jgi:hypothetical protein